MGRYPEPLRRLIEAFLVLPGIGRKTAERFAFALVQGRAEAARELGQSIVELHAKLTACGECGQFGDASPCATCLDPQRSSAELCVVADSRDIIPLEQTGTFRGRYFVLGGLLNPLEGVHAEQLRLVELEQRLKRGEVQELILALNVTVEGDATALYLSKHLKPLGVRVTRLARGLPTGSRLEYADELTLSSALAGRREI